LVAGRSPRSKSVEVGRIERETRATPETLGLSLGEAKRLSAAIQNKMVRSQAGVMGERFRCCGRCGSNLSSKGYRQVTYQSLFGEVPFRVRRFQICPCLEAALRAPRTVSALALEGGIAPGLASVTAKFAALAPFAKLADFHAELLPLGGVINAGTIRNRTRRVGERIARLQPAGAPEPETDDGAPHAVVIGLDGGYLRSRHRRPERNFEVIAGKVLHHDGSQHRFTFARNGDSEREFSSTIVSATIRPGAPATVLSDGDAGLWKLQRQVVPQKTLVLDWWHIAMRFGDSRAGECVSRHLAGYHGLLQIGYTAYKKARRPGTRWWTGDTRGMLGTSAAQILRAPQGRRVGHRHLVGGAHGIALGRRTASSRSRPRSAPSCESEPVRADCLRPLRKVAFRARQNPR
jgi:hypothetical protein